MRTSAGRKHVADPLESNGVDLAPPSAVEQVAIVGAGTMGTAIAAANVQQDVPVVLSDVDPLALESALERIASHLADAGRPPSPQVVESIRHMVTLSTDEVRIGRCSLVLESIIESEAAKQQLYARLEPHLSPATIWASNTSTIPIGRLSAKLADGRRFLGLHFLHPTLKHPLVEIVPSSQTCEATVAAAEAYVRSIHRTPIIVGDHPGFLVNRLLFPYLSEALELLLDGAAPNDIDGAATEFGMTLGPLQLMDEIGLDTVVAGGKVLWQAFPGRINPSPLLVAMYKAGRWGRKSGAGFFAHPIGPGAREPGRPDPAVDGMIATWARRPLAIPAEGILARLLLSMLLEATRVLEERQVADPQTIDLAMVAGLGFPIAQGGLLRWADALGTKHILGRLKELEPLGPRFIPTGLLTEMAARSQSFYSRA